MLILLQEEGEVEDGRLETSDAADEERGVRLGCSPTYNKTTTKNKLISGV